MLKVFELLSLSTFKKTLILVPNFQRC